MAATWDSVPVGLPLPTGKGILPADRDLAGPDHSDRRLPANPKLVPSKATHLDLISGLGMSRPASIPAHYRLTRIYEIGHLDQPCFLGGFKPSSHCFSRLFARCAFFSDYISPTTIEVV